MDAEKRKNWERYGYFAAAGVLVAVMIGLFGLPFFKMDGLFVADNYRPMSLSAFSLMANVFQPQSFRFSDNRTAYTDSVNEVLSLYYAGGVLHWLLLVAFLAIVVLIVVAVLKKRTPYLSFALLAAVLLSFSLLVVFSVMTNRVNALYLNYLGVDYLPYRFFSDSTVLFGLSAAGFFGAVLFEQFALAKYRPVKVRAECVVCEEASHEIYYAEGEESRVLIFNGDVKKTESEKFTDASRYEMSVGIKNADLIGLADKMSDVVKKVGMPMFVGEDYTAYWWRNARTRTEYLTNKLAEVPDSELKIGFAADKTITRVTFNANGGAFQNKNVKHQTICGKKERYAPSELDCVAKDGVQVEFYDGSFLKIAAVAPKIPVALPGVAEVFWEAEGITFSDRIEISAKDESED